MGCCSSSPEGSSGSPSSPRSGGLREDIGNSQGQRQHHRHHHHRLSQNRRSRAGGAGGGGDLPQMTIPTGTNKPLVSRYEISWTSPTPLTRGQLNGQRDGFWDTQPKYGGRQEVWQALKAVCEAPTDELAQAIMVSLNLVLPTGRLTDGCYDELGNHYIIPHYCITEPTNMLKDDSDDNDDVVGGLGGERSVGGGFSKSNNTSTQDFIQLNTIINNNREDGGGVGGGAGGLADQQIDTRTNSVVQPPTTLLQPPFMTSNRFSSVSQQQQTVTADHPIATASNTTSPSPLPPLILQTTSAKATTTTKLTLTCRLSSSKDVKVQVTPEDTFAAVRVLLIESEQFNPKLTKLRIIHFGKVCEENVKVKDVAKINDGSVIQVMIQTKQK